MTSIVFCFNDDEVVVVMDTLAIDESRQPLRYTTKAHYLPHLRTIIAGTGCGGFADDWFAEVNKRMTVRDVVALNQFAPAALRGLWERYRRDYSLPDGATTTVFHFGFSEGTGRVVATQFHSGHDFRAERIDPGLHCKPPCPTPPEIEQEGVGIFDLAKQLMEAQRAHEAERQDSDRAYIGGEAMALHLTKAGCAHFPLFEFPEFQEEREEVLLKATQAP